MTIEPNSAFKIATISLDAKRRQLHAPVGPPASVKMTFRTRVGMARWRCGEIGIATTFHTRVSIARWRCGEVSRRDDVPHTSEHSAMAFGRGGHVRRRSAQSRAWRNGVAVRSAWVMAFGRGGPGVIALTRGGMRDNVAHASEPGVMALQWQERYKKRSHKGGPTAWRSAAASAPPPAFKKARISRAKRSAGTPCSAASRSRSLGSYLCVVVWVCKIT